MGVGDRGDPVPAAELVDLLGEGRPVDELHGVIVDPALAADRVDRDDVRMVQVRGRLGLDAEPGYLLRVDGGGEREDLQRDATAQRVLFGLVDDAHPAAAELADHAEIAEPGGVGCGEIGRRWDGAVDLTAHCPLLTAHSLVHRLGGGLEQVEAL